jgi:hypothetical protein
LKVLETGELLNRTVALMRIRIIPTVASFATLSLVGIFIDAVEFGGTILYTLISLGLQAWITLKMLKELDLETPHEKRRNYFGALFGLGIVTGLAVLLGFLFFVVPGIYLLVRWSISVPALFAKPLTIIEAMRESWDLTKGHFWPIFLSTLIVFVPFALGLMALVLPALTSPGVGLDVTQSTAASIFSNGCFALATVANWYLALTIYEGLSGKKHGLAEIFS